MIDLNGKDFAEKTVAIFNNGKAGIAKNVDVRIEKKQPTDTPGTPDFKVYFTDEIGTINQGFYYFTPNPKDSLERQKQRETQEVSRVLHIARAVLGSDYAFPAVNTTKEAYDMLFNLSAKNLAGKKFNVFVTYGTKDSPNKKGYLGVRYFNFIEPADVEVSRLIQNDRDLMERVVADSESSLINNGSSTDTTTDNWL